MTNQTSNNTHVKPGALRIGHSSPLWRTRRAVRKLYHAGHIMRRNKQLFATRHRRLHVYENVDEFADAFFPVTDHDVSKQAALGRVTTMINQLGYTIVEADEQKPWGGMYRLADEQAGRFITEFFPGLTLHEAQLGRSDVKLSPKFILLEPGKRLSWQYHHRRAERWHFLIAGSYTKSRHDKQPSSTIAPAGTIVQLAQGDRHRLGAVDDFHYALVAEVWQHTDPAHLSDEADIVRLQDDYRRA